LSAKDYPVTTGIRELKKFDIEFVPYVYDYEEKGGTKQTADELMVDEHNVVKTLVMEDDTKSEFIVLMHGDREVSTKELARQIGVKTISPASADKAFKATGYQFGGTSPLGTKKKMQVYAENTILGLDKIYINGGKRGFIIEINPQDLNKIFDLKLVNVAISKAGK
jgi:Cys-tRNA(Pro) deacylase